MNTCNYDFSINIKYHEIYNELKEKYKSEKINDDELYSIEDINDICNRLYIEEYLAAFKSDNLVDDTIDITSRQIYNILMTFSRIEDFFKSLNSWRNTFYNINHCQCQEQKQEQEQDYYDIFLMLFCSELFYITHKLLILFSDYNNENQIMIDNLLSIIFDEYRKIEYHNNNNKYDCTDILMK